MGRAVRIRAVRPLVRYVDEDQAVIDTHLIAASMLPGADAEPDALPPNPLVDVVLEIDGADGFHDEGRTRVRLVDGHAAMRFEMVRPQRWWPAGMGEQPLYDFTVHVLHRDDEIEQRKITLGLTSVRRDRVDQHGDVAFLVNGQVCNIRHVITVDRVDERHLLPVTGTSLLLVRDHYGPDVLYDAADRAGILLVQCIPIHPDGTPEVDVQAQVDRLSPHPSLAGWFVGHLGQISDTIAQQIATLDPTRTVFRELPRVAA